MDGRTERERETCRGSTEDLQVFAWRLRGKKKRLAGKRHPLPRWGEGGACDSLPARGRAGEVSLPLEGEGKGEGALLPPPAETPPASPRQPRRGSAEGRGQRRLAALGDAGRQRSGGAEPRAVPALLAPPSVTPRLEPARPSLAEAHSGGGSANSPFGGRLGAERRRPAPLGVPGSPREEPPGPSGAGHGEPPEPEQPQLKVARGGGGARSFPGRVGWGSSPDGGREVCPPPQSPSGRPAAGEKLQAAGGGPLSLPAGDARLPSRSGGLQAESEGAPPRPPATEVLRQGGALQVRGGTAAPRVPGLGVAGAGGSGGLRSAVSVRGFPARVFPARIRLLSRGTLRREAGRR